MNVLFFDTETTGLPLNKEPSDHPDQPYTVSIAAMLHNPSRDVIGTISALIKPEGWVIDETGRAFEAHGITNERAMDEGRPMADVLEEFLVLLNATDILCAHNVSFDCRIMRIITKRAGREIGCFFTGHDKREASGENKLRFCTMINSTKLVNLPPTEKMLAAGFRGPKSPNLVEAYRHFFNEELDGAHDALVDMEASARVYYHLKDNHPPASKTVSPVRDDRFQVRPLRRAAY